MGALFVAQPEDTLHLAPRARPPRSPAHRARRRTRGNCQQSVRLCADIDVDESGTGDELAEDEVVADSTDGSARCRRFIRWVQTRGYEVVVFDMDRTMTAGHCGAGILRGPKLEQYVSAVSPDFIEAARALHALPSPGVRLAVATGSDPVEYDRLGSDARETHILGPDLAQEVIRRTCPEALPGFKVMVGFDCRLHDDRPQDKGKRHHMREISERYDNVPFERMILFDDSAMCLANEDGWRGVLVRQRCGFRFEDCPGYDRTPGIAKQSETNWCPAGNQSI